MPWSGRLDGVTIVVQRVVAEQQLRDGVDEERISLEWDVNEGDVGVLVDVSVCVITFMCNKPKPHLLESQSEPFR